MKEPPSERAVSCESAMPGRGSKSAATKASALVAATARKGARSVNAAASRPPIAGPATFPAELAAEMMLLAKERRGRGGGCGMERPAEARVAAAPNLAGAPE